MADRADCRATTATPTIDRRGIVFAELAKEHGLRYARPRQLRPMSIRDAFGCGCAAFDYDDDGWQGVLLVADPHPLLYRNLGGGDFENVSKRVGLSGKAYSGSSARQQSPALTRASQRAARRPTEMRRWSGWTVVANGDYDTDGRLDVLLTGSHWLALLKNDSGAFTDVTAQSGL